MSNTIQVSLEKLDSSSGAYNHVRVKDGNGHHLDISLRRTVRVPDNDTTYNLPPDCGAFPLYSVDDHKEKLPPTMVAKGGVFVPMFQREAMWINFSACHPFAVKVFAGGVNAISGESKKAPRQVPSGKQDYVVPPEQRWLDGIAHENGKVSQFVAASIDSGYSVEAQVTGEDSICGLQIEVITRKSRCYENTFTIVIQMLTGKRLSIEVAPNTLVIDVKEMIFDREGIPEDQQRLVADRRQLEDGGTLSDYNIQSDSIIQLVLRLRGGGGPIPPDQSSQLVIAAGGAIKQTIVEDTVRADRWNAEHSVMFNISLINASSLASIGLPTMSSPITAETYARLGYPFFKMYEEPSNVSGKFELKTVGKLDKLNDIKQELHAAEKKLNFEEVEIPTSGECPISTEVVLNTIDPISTFFPVRTKIETDE